MDMKNNLPAQIIGELICMEKYKLIDGKIIASIVTDTINTLEELETIRKEG
jgi:hypothetical protein